MSISFSLVRKAPARSEVHGVPVCSDQVDDRPGDLDWDVLVSRGFDGRAGVVQIVGDGKGNLVAAVGMGPSADVTPLIMRRAAAGFVRAVRRHKKVSTSMLDAVPEDGDKAAAARALAEGMVMGAYSYGELKSDPKPNAIETVAVVGTGGQKVSQALDVGVRVGDAVGFARDLVNEPGGSLTPPKFARIAQAMAKREGLRVKVLGLPEIKKAKLGGILGVNRGSTLPPRLVEITYLPKGKRAGHLALVGKGITFDAGGLSIKSGVGMMTMKCDMGGAAAVLGTMSAIKAVAPKVKVTAYVPMTDNMLGGDATRPGDVLKIRNGKTVEVLNTDAEGRLILADALSLATEAKPDAIIDLATLTGSCMSALGRDFAGLMGNNNDWIVQVRDAAGRVDESLWHLPLPAQYRSQLDSPIADMKNIGTAYAGALTAGLFLKEFVGDSIPWAHLDIAGPAWTETNAGLTSKGGTGYGVRLLLEVLESFTNPNE